MDQEELIDIELKKLFGGEYEVYVEVEGKDPLNFTSLMRLAINTIRILVKKIKAMEACDGETCVEEDEEGECIDPPHLVE